MAALREIDVHGIKVHVFSESIMVEAVTFGRRAGSTLMSDEQIYNFVEKLMLIGARQNQRKIKDVLGIKT